MRMRSTAAYLIYLAAPLLLAHADALPHDDHHPMEADMDMKEGMHSNHSGSASSNHTAGDNQDYPMSYFAYQKHSGVLIAHVVFMVLAWFFTLPIGEISPSLKWQKFKEETKLTRERSFQV